MKKESTILKIPRKKDLEIGNIIPIYLYPLEFSKFRGNGLLLERQKNKEDLKYIRDFLFKPVDSLRKKDIKCRYEKWIVRILDGPEKGNKIFTKIGYKT